MQELISQKNKRIFCLSMHQKLVKIEIERLRILGYEVFEPPYLKKPIRYQTTVWDWKQQSSSGSTLPLEALTILAKTNFFTSFIPQLAAEILNQYFGTILVFSNQIWLKNILEVYRGKIIYRVHGQPYSLSQDLVNHSILDLIIERENFWFCPHHEKALLIEDLWLTRLNTRIIPCCLPNDIIRLQDTWEFKESYDTCIGLICPNILNNPFSYRYYGDIQRYFSGEQFKVFGTQVVTVPDPLVLGTLERKDFLAHFIKLHSFVYHYTESAFCHLAPIEFMTLGGPVLFQKGSLLSAYFENMSAPGEAKDIKMLTMRAKQLLKKHACTLSNEIIDSQKKVRMLYHPNYVWPIFDKVIMEILGSNIPAPAEKIIYNINKETAYNLDIDTEKSILIPFHHFGCSVVKDQETSYHMPEGIFRVINLMVKALIDNDKTIIITSYRRDFGKVHGFFAQQISNYSKIKILILENKNIYSRIKCKIKLSLKRNIFLTKIKYKIKLFLKRNIFLTKIIYRIKFYLKENIFLKKTILSYKFFFNLINNFLFSSYVSTVNKSKSISHVIVPHYYTFPETFNMKKPIFLYIPDYLPHFYPKSLDMGSHWTWRLNGKKLANKAKLILTNSEFTRNYLPATKLKVIKEKIIKIPLAYLNQIQKVDDDAILEEFIKSLPPLFVFYPTRARPSKRLNDFSETVRIVNNRLQASDEKRRVYGVLTTPFTPDVPNEYLISLPTLPDKTLAEIYKRATALLFTSENEGNFPTQINEALYLNTPIIATNIPQITDELVEKNNALQLVEVGNCIKFADAVLYTMNNRALVLATQQITREFAIKNFSYEQFSTQLLAIFFENSTDLTTEPTI
jgi:glycosyltransferase involved in cell wall biosynthesis